MRQFLILALAVGAVSGAGAQTEPPRDGRVVAGQPNAEAPREGRARFMDPEDGQFDLSYFLEPPAAGRNQFVSPGTVLHRCLLPFEGAPDGLDQSAKRRT